MSIETQNEKTIARVGDARQETLEQDAPECRRCEGWGVVLGTDTEDSHGQICDCGQAFTRPVGAEKAELEAAHARARAARPADDRRAA